MTDLIALSAFLASTAGSGWLASVLLDQLREATPKPDATTWQAGTRMQRLAWTLLYAPRYVRYVVLLLAALISLSANTALALVAGLTPALALDAALAVVASQIRHSLTMKDTL